LCWNTIAANHNQVKKHGTDRKGNPRVRCILCGKTLTVVKRPLGTMRTKVKDAATALGMLLEGLSIRSVDRLTGLHRDTNCELALVVGDNCEQFLTEKVKGVACDHVQCDEIWSFVGCKERTGHATRDDAAVYAVDQRLQQEPEAPPGYAGCVLRVL
jgi:transposase-like protein